MYKDISRIFAIIICNYDATLGSLPRATVSVSLFALNQTLNLYYHFLCYLILHILYY